MNYLSIINSFWNSVMYSPLSTGEVAMYMALVHLCSRNNWAEWFMVPTKVLSLMTGLSAEGMVKARESLEWRGLIKFRYQQNSSGLYGIIIAGVSAGYLDS